MNAQATNKAAYPLKLPRSVKNVAMRLAKEDGVSLNQWIAVAVAEKVGALDGAAAFLKHKAGEAKPTDLLPYLDRAAGEKPSDSDTL